MMGPNALMNNSIKGSHQISLYVAYQVPKAVDNEIKPFNYWVEPQ